MKIIEFKNKKQKFEDWLKEIKEQNFKDAEIQSALFMWELPPDEEGYTVSHCRYNVDLETLKFYHRQLGEFIKEWEFDKYLTEHINEYITHID